jgi:RNA polymerase sigma-70 factor, ECF subfamily
VRNTALKMRKNARRELAFEEDTLNACEREQACPNPASCIPDSMALRSMLDQLEPKHRASLLLAIIDGRTHQEIAEYLRVPIGTVKAWIRRELVAMRARNAAQDRHGFAEHRPQRSCCRRDGWGRGRRRRGQA